jgi:hypothetical protein
MVVGLLAIGRNLPADFSQPMSADQATATYFADDSVYDGFDESSDYGQLLTASCGVGPMTVVRGI